MDTLGERGEPFKAAARHGVILGLATCVFLAGAVFASTMPYRPVIAVEVLGMSSAAYAALAAASSVAGALASVLFGYLSDRVRDRRWLILLTCAAGLVGMSAIYLFRSVEVFVVATCVILPFSSPLFSQTFAYSRVVLEATRPDRAVFFISALRSVFAGAWVVVPPVAGMIAASSSPFEIYAVGAVAFVICGALIAAIAGALTVPSAAAAPTAEKAKNHNQPTLISYVVGFTGLLFVRVAIAITIMTLPLLIVQTLNGSLGQLGLHSGLAALIEIPFMLVWGWLASRYFSKELLLGINACIFGIYLFFASNAQSVYELYWLLLLNSVATAALFGLSISYIQEAIFGKVGLSTSLIDVMSLISALIASACFGWLTVVSDLRTTLLAAGAFSAAGGILLLASRVRQRPNAAVAADP